MNKQYQELRVVEGEYIPRPAMDYPQDNPFARTLFPKYIKPLAIDEHYPYVDDSWWYRMKTMFAYFFILTAYSFRFLFFLFGFSCFVCFILLISEIFRGF
jgi:hypothetical protein